MPEPLLGTDKHGLSTLMRRWAPKGMRRTVEGRRAIETLADGFADAFNLMIEFEQYMPIIMNPSRCLDNDLFRILDLNGIESRDGITSLDKLRRLAMLGPELRAWRGAFRSHRTVTSALTGGPVIIRTWIVLRFILSETSISELILLDEDQESESQIFVLGQGPDALQFSQSEVENQIDRLAKPILDEILITPCFALTAWRNGIGTWATDTLVGELELVEAVGLPSTESGEFEALDMGPDITSLATQFVRGPTRAPTTTSDLVTLWTTVWFKTGDSTLNDFWEIMLFSTDDAAGSGDAYVLKVRVGNSFISFHRRVSGVTGPSLGSHSFTIVDGLLESYHRVDFMVHKNSTTTKLWAYVNHDPSFVFEDPVVAARPDGKRVFAGLRPVDFTTGRLRIATITARLNEGS